MSFKKAVAIILAVVVVVNFLFLILRIIKPLEFWLLSAAFAAVAYFVVPRIGKTDSI